MRAIAEEEAVAPSMLSSLLSGSAPASRPSPALVAVRRHTLDDTEPGKRSLNPGTPIRPVGKPRDFTAADKALIRRVHAYMNPLQLLGILNTRLTCDLGVSVDLYTIDQLRTEIASVSSAVPAGGNDWGSLRKLLAKARRDGVLEGIAEQTLNDFAVVYSISQKQLLVIKDTVLQAMEDGQ